jgi:hypothetical protein
MAACGGDCTTFSASNAKWFKLNAGGYDPSTKLWAADKLRASEQCIISMLRAHINHVQMIILGYPPFPLSLRQDNMYVTFLINIFRSLRNIYIAHTQRNVGHWNQSLIHSNHLCWHAPSIALHSVTPQFYPSCAYVSPKHLIVFFYIFVT